MEVSKLRYICCWCQFVSVGPPLTLSMWLRVELTRATLVKWFAKSVITGGIETNQSLCLWLIQPQFILRVNINYVTASMVDCYYVRDEKNQWIIDNYRGIRTLIYRQMARFSLWPSVYVVYMYTIFHEDTLNYRLSTCLCYLRNSSFNNNISI